MEKRLNALKKRLMLDEITFYSICSDLDRQKILNQVPMSFNDFQRLSLLTDYLELDALHNFIWETHVKKFTDEIEDIYKKCELPNEEISEMLLETDQWLDDFCKQAPNAAVSSLLREIFSNELDYEKKD